MVNGKLKLMNPPTFRHILIAKFIERELDKEIAIAVDTLLIKSERQSIKLELIAQKICSRILLFAFIIHN